MSWQQVKSFNLGKMGTRKGWCLENVAKGFGVYGAASAQPSAKADMQFNKNKGTLHKDNPPTNVAVPVYLDTVSQYEHIEVCVKGIYYSDGVKVGKPSNTFGWGEYCNGVRVVKWVDDSKQSFLPSRGYWKPGDNDPRVASLARFMYTTFPAYTSEKALGSYYGKYIESSIKEFQKRTGLESDGCVGPITYAKLKEYGFDY